ncbi:MAG TPA: hypothetical protein VIC87_11375 [Vicinamibacteria bacterium]
MLQALILALAAAAPPPEKPASPVQVEASPSKTEVTVGEAFTIEVKATGPAGTSYTFAAEAEHEQLELRTPANAATSPMPGLHRYGATLYALGEVEIPPIPVKYRLPDGSEGMAQTEPLKVKVVSLLPKDAEAQKLSDIRGPVGLDVGRAFWVGLAAAVLVVVALVLWLWRRKRKSTVQELPAPEVPPDEEALRALERLAASGQIGRGEMRPFYIALTEIAKRYLERRLGAPVQEMTSAEMIAFLREGPHEQALLAPLRELAGAADRVKFARGEGLREEAERHLAAARSVIATLEERLRPKETTASPSAGKAA